jgi:quinol monooxygenase YgiN
MKLHRPMMSAIAVGISAAVLLLAAAAVDAASDSARPMVRIAELEIDPEQLDAYKAILAEEQEASVRLEPGVLMLHSVALAASPTSIRLLEVYASRSAYEAHIQSPHFVKYKTSTETMVKSLRLVDTTPILLCAKARGPAGGPATC